MASVNPQLSLTWNHNVKLTFLFSGLQSFGRGIWMGNILSAYIYFLAGESNTILGWTSAATGFAFTLSLFPSGYLADKIRRDLMIRFASIFGIIGIVVIFLANSIFMIFIALLFWGLAQGITRPSLESLLADSVQSRNRSSIYSKLHLIRNTAMSVGPFVNVLLFLLLGDIWDIGILKSVMYVGLVITLSSVIVMQYFSDDKSLGSISESVLNGKTGDDNDFGITTTPNKYDRSKLIPYFIVLSNLLIGIGAGMTIKFFPIFFLDIYKMLPIGVNLILGFTSLATGLAGLGAQRLSYKQGRVWMIIIVQLIATGCLFLISFIPPLVMLIPLFIARGSLMNASRPLSRSIVMDYIPKGNRGKWNAVEALAWGLFWNMSAVFGGYLIDDYSFQIAFRITATIYTIGTLPLFYIARIVVKEKTGTILKDDEFTLKHKDNITKEDVEFDSSSAPAKALIDAE